MTGQGKVWLVGAGPGDPELITRKGHRLLHAADVVVHDRLVSAALIAELPPSIERIDVGKTPGSSFPAQSNINEILVRMARQGKRVVRLKGGDPYIFGRGAEERQALLEAGCAVEVVPGISALTGATATAGLSLTRRGLSSTFAVMTGRPMAGHTLPKDQWRALAGLDTVVVFMGVGAALELQTELVAAGRAPDTPVLLINDGTLPTQSTHRTMLGQLDATVSEQSIGNPTIIVIGEVAGAWNPEDEDLASPDAAGFVRRDADFQLSASASSDQVPGPREPSGLYPMTLTNLAGRRALVAGGGRVGARKVRRLLDVGAQVVLCSPTATADLQDWSRSGEVHWIRGRYRPDYLKGCCLVFAATNDHRINVNIAQDAADLGLFCNVATDTTSGDFRVPAVLETDGLLVAVSSVEGDPRRVRRLRDRIREHLVPPEG